jgi:DNA-binding SARP family transcriptional activator
MARRRLSQALWRIRDTIVKSLTVHVLRTESDTVQIHPALDLWTDVEAFESRVTRGEWALAVDLYRGDFMAGYYDDWLLTERERLRERFLTVLGQRVEMYKRRSDYQRALVYARRWVAEAPWHEEAHREIMRLCHLLGRDTEALQQFEVCVKRLREDFDTSPGSGTVALAQEIAHSSPSDEAPYLPQIAPVPLRVMGGDADSLQTPLIGRRTERAVLLSALEGAIHGMGGLVLVEGAAGVGKTRLLQELARDAEWRGIQTLWGHSQEMLSSAPFAPWLDALRSTLSPLRVEQWSQLVAPVWLQVLRPLLPELAAVAPEPATPLEPGRERERMIDALTQLLAAWVEVNPMVLILEDLHWADEESLALLVAIHRRLQTHSIVIVGSFRGDEARARPVVWEQLQNLHRVRQHRWLRLLPLDVESSGELIRRSLGMKLAAPRFASQLYQ